MTERERAAERVKEKKKVRDTETPVQTGLGCRKKTGREKKSLAISVKADSRPCGQYEHIFVHILTIFDIALHYKQLTFRKKEVSL